MNGNIIRLAVVDSTNLYSARIMSQSVIEPWTVVVADNQSAGKGQRGRVWDSEYGKNLLCSVILFPTHIRIHEQFLISAAASLAVCHTLREFHIESRVKWPNDVLVNGKKIAGLLIENQWTGQALEACIVGLGLNVNQRVFNVYQRSATSIANENHGAEEDLDSVLSLFLEHFRQFMQQSRTAPVSLLNAYNSMLEFRSKHVWLDVAQQRIKGVLRGVTLRGELVIHTEDGDRLFVNGEVRLADTIS